jgi:hypothetical protein
VVVITVLCAEGFVAVFTGFWLKALLLLRGFHVLIICYGWFAATSMLGPNLLNNSCKYLLLLNIPVNIFGIYAHMTSRVQIDFYMASSTKFNNN